MKAARALVLGLVVGAVALTLATALDSEPAPSTRRWTRKSADVLLSDATIAFLDELEASTGIAFVVTSGRRTYAQQAQEMIEESASALHSLYRADSVIDALLAAERTIEAWAAVIEDYARRGIVLSWHAVDPERAVDLRTRDLSDEQISRLRSAAVALGAQAVLESDHLHLEEWPA